MPDPRLKMIVAGDLANNKELHELMLKAHEVLRVVLGPAGTPTTAEWSLLPPDEKGRRAIGLALSEMNQRVEIKFAPDELNNPRKRLDRALADLKSTQS